MKSKKVIYWLCGLVIVMSIGLGLYVHFELQPLQSPQYRITEIELINALGGKPALWLCIGIVIAVTFFRAQKSQKAANICLGLGGHYHTCVLCDARILLRRELCESIDMDFKKCRRVYHSRYIDRGIVW